MKALPIIIAVSLILGAIFGAAITSCDYVKPIYSKPKAVKAAYYDVITYETRLEKR